MERIGPLLRTGGRCLSWPEHTHTRELFRSRSMRLGTMFTRMDIPQALFFFFFFLLLFSPHRKMAPRLSPPPRVVAVGESLSSWSRPCFAVSKAAKKSATNFSHLSPSPLLVWYFLAVAGVASGPRLCILFPNCYRPSVSGGPIGLRDRIRTLPPRVSSLFKDG